MAINKKIMNFETLELFQSANGIGTNKLIIDKNDSSLVIKDPSVRGGLRVGNIPYVALVTIKDSGQIWSHGRYLGASIDVSRIEKLLKQILEDKLDKDALIEGSNISITEDEDKFTIASKTSITLGTAGSTNTTELSHSTLTFEGGTNLFKIGDGTNSITIPITPSITNNITGSGTSGYLTKWNGSNTITKGPQLSTSISNWTQNVKFLAEDGTWHTPIYTSNTDKTGIKLKTDTVYGVKLTNSTLLTVDSSTGLWVKGGTNLFMIGDGTNYIEVPITLSYTNSRDAGYGKIDIYNNKDKKKSGSITALTYSEVLKLKEGANITLSATESSTNGGDLLEIAVNNVMTTSHVANGITALNITNWNNVHSWYTTAAGNDTTGVIDNWNEIKKFVASFKETDDLASYIANNYVAKTSGLTASSLFTGVSDSISSTKSLTNGNVYLNLTNTVNGTVGNAGSIKISGSTNVSVTTDANGNIVITGPNLSSYKTTDTQYYLTLNGTVKGTASTNNLGTIYAPTSAGTSGQILKSSGLGAPTWDDFCNIGTTDFVTSKSIAIKSDDWVEVGTINTYGTGTYAIQVIGPNTISSGVFSILKDSVDTQSDEILLHHMGTGDTIFAKTSENKLYVASSAAGTKSLTIKIKKLI